MATASWHKDYDYITWPPRESHRDDWLVDCQYGDCPPNASKLRKIISDWLAGADLSALDDNDDEAGHKALADSLWAAIKVAQTNHA